MEGAATRYDGRPAAVGTIKLPIECIKCFFLPGLLSRALCIPAALQKPLYSMDDGTSKGLVTRGLSWVRYFIIYCYDVTA